MIDAEYIEEIAEEIEALMREQETIRARIKGWRAEAMEAGSCCLELTEAIIRRRAMRDVASTLGHTMGFRDSVRHIQDA